MCNGRKRAGPTIWPLTHPAGKADFHSGGRKIHSIAIDDIRGMGNITAHGHDIDRGRIAPAFRPAGNGLGKAEKSFCRGELSDLHFNAPGRCKGRMRDPARAGTARAHDRKARRGKALADIACRINAKKEKRHAPGAVPLHG